MSEEAEENRCLGSAMLVPMRKRICVHPRQVPRRKTLWIVRL